MLEHILSQSSFHPILPYEISEFVPINLSMNNPKLINIDFSNTIMFKKYIDNYLKLHSAVVAYGGYNEPRAIYKRSKNFNSSKEERFIHLGIDLWTKADTPIYAPLKGKVHSYRNNIGLGNYGPTIILEHKIESIIFYTLFGHLTLTSIQNIKKGDLIKEGEKVGAIGNHHINGDYPPHLHFQIIKELNGMEGDFSGVTSLKDRDVFLMNCPNPNLILKITS